MKNERYLYSVAEVTQLIKEGKTLSIAADELLLDQLPQGRWIGGTIPYFIGENGGICTRDQLFVNILPDYCKVKAIKQYNSAGLDHIIQDYSQNGFSFIIIPAMSRTHIEFANYIVNREGLFNSPLVGWISGVHLYDLETNSPYIYNGLTGIKSNQDAIVLHIDLPKNRYAKVETINLFTPGNQDRIEFDTEGFVIQEALINGKKMNFSNYLIENNIDTELPLVSNHSGAMINSSIQTNDLFKKEVTLYAPIFKNTEYKMVKPVLHYEEAFKEIVQNEIINPVFSCNCILNYLYAHLEKKRPGGISGPITFGEIAYVLLNQTMVYLTVHKKKFWER